MESPPRIDEARSILHDAEMSVALQVTGVGAPGTEIRRGGAVVPVAAQQ
jgi:hypothetical protein